MASVRGFCLLPNPPPHDHTVFPPELCFAVVKFLHRLRGYFSSHCHYDITEIDDVNTNELYNPVKLYRIRLHHPPKPCALNSSFTFALSNNDRLVDCYRGVAVEWEHVVTQCQGQSFSWRPLLEERRGFTLHIQKKNSNSCSTPTSISSSEKPTKSAGEIRIDCSTPNTFETLAMDPQIRKNIESNERIFWKKREEE